MIVDSSAVLAIFLDEPEASEFVTLLVQSAVKRISAGNYLECAIRLDNIENGSSMELDAFLDEAQIEIVPVTATQARLARLAHRRWGRGRHPAGLNYGDCLAYALAQDRGEPLLFKGGDFSQTDIIPAR